MKKRSIILATFLVTAGAILFLKPWRPLIYGRVAPPVADLTDALPSVASRIRSLIDDTTKALYSAEAWGTLGAVYDVHEYHENAILCYERAEELDPAEFRWPYLRAVRIAQSDRDGTREALLTALAIDSSYAPAHVRLGNLNLEDERLDDAERHFQQAAELDATLVLARLGLGRVALARDDGATAVRLIGEALSIGAISAEVRLSLAEAHRNLGNTSQVERFSGETRSLPPREPLPDRVLDQIRITEGLTARWRKERSRIALARGDSQTAIKEWQDYLRDDPDSVEPHISLGEIYAGSAQYESAIESYRMALAKDPELYLIEANLGLLLVQTGQTEAGIAALAKLSRSHPDDAAVCLQYAAALRGTGRAQEAEAVHREILRRNPGDVKTAIEFASLLGASGRLDESVRVLARARDTAPLERLLHTNLAIAYNKMRRHPETQATLEYAVRCLPGDHELRRHLAWRLATCPDDRYRNGRRAIEVLAPLTQLGRASDSTTLDTLAAAHAAAGEFQQAVEAAVRAREIARANTPPDQLEATLAVIEQRITLYRDRRPYLEGR